MTGRDVAEAEHAIESSRVAMKYTGNKYIVPGVLLASSGWPPLQLSPHPLPPISAGLVRSKVSTRVKVSRCRRRRAPRSVCGVDRASGAGDEGRAGDRLAIGLERSAAPRSEIDRLLGPDRLRDLGPRDPETRQGGRRDAGREQDHRGGDEDGRVRRFDTEEESTDRLRSDPRRRGARGRSRRRRGTALLGGSAGSATSGWLRPPCGPPFPVSDGSR